ncbi:APC family permease [Sulfurovum riftiae]|uniref:Amino acid transporter n=1 Tax=Sulfurovum riftiae TaxID=1630136 RepID=A0A151CI87_9BACT|nr:APC family permease [Sulfurovum riftiae]KYJ87236.1 amino acid transporter [Sulfurovum riftiae]
MSQKKIGFIEAFSIGVGGMVGGGIFAVLGLTIDLAKGAAPIAFLVAGFIALVTAYSYVKLSLRYPSEGGSIEFIVQAFGNGLFSSIINNLLLISYVIMLALYAYAFGSYGSALILGTDVEWLHKTLAVGVILVFMFINLLGAFLTGRAEDLMVFAKLAILAVFAAVGTASINMAHMAPQEWMPLPSVVTGGLIIFLAYEGFELIANTARDIKDPEKTLPRAYYSAVIFVIILYVWIAMVTVGNLSFEAAKNAQDYVLAEAAEPFFGKTGFIIIGIAALLSTASAINATLYGGGRTSYLIARYGELPGRFENKFKNGYEGMIIIALLGVIFATSFNLDNISVAGSLGFLIVFSLVNYANFKLYKETGGNRLISGGGTLLGLTATGVLIGHNLIHSPKSLITSGIVILAVSVFSFTYYHLKEKRLSLYMDKDLEKDELHN